MEKHRVFNRVFSPNRLTLGIFLPLEVNQPNQTSYATHIEQIKRIDNWGFPALWVRDIPIYDPSFGDVGQVFDALNYLSFIAGQTKHIALGTASIVMPLWHPIALAKTVATLDQLSDNRVILGVGSGDRMAEFPAFGLDFNQRGARFREVFEQFKQHNEKSFAMIQSTLSNFAGMDVVPKPISGKVPILLTGRSQQTLAWNAQNADGWITYPGATTTAEDTALISQKINAWRNLIPNGAFKPHMTNEWIELSEDPHFPRTPLRGGFILKTGRLGLIELLYEWEQAGVNHAAVGIHFSKRPTTDVIDELATEVLPLFPGLKL